MFADLDTPIPPFVLTINLFLAEVAGQRIEQLDKTALPYDINQFDLSPAVEFYIQTRKLDKRTFLTAIRRVVLTPFVLRHIYGRKDWIVCDNNWWKALSG